MARGVKNVLGGWEIGGGGVLRSFLEGWEIFGGGGFEKFSGVGVEKFAGGGEVDGLDRPIIIHLEINYIM